MEEHGIWGARAAAPIAKDVITYLYDPARAWATLLELEKGWGGTPQQRMEAKYRSFVSQAGVSAPKVGDDQAVKAAIIKADNTEAPVDAVGTTPDTAREEPSDTSTTTPAAPSTKSP